MDGPTYVQAAPIRTRKNGQEWPAGGAGRWSGRHGKVTIVRPSIPMHADAANAWRVPASCLCTTMACRVVWWSPGLGAAGESRPLMAWRTGRPAAFRRWWSRPRCRASPVCREARHRHLPLPPLHAPCLCLDSAARSLSRPIAVDPTYGLFVLLELRIVDRCAAPPRSSALARPAGGWVCIMLV